MPPTPLNNVWLFVVCKLEVDLEVGSWTLKFEVQVGSGSWKSLKLVFSLFKLTLN